MSTSIDGQTTTSQNFTDELQLLTGEVAERNPEDLFKIDQLISLLKDIMADTKLINRLPDSASYDKLEQLIIALTSGSIDEIRKAIAHDCEVTPLAHPTILDINPDSYIDRTNPNGEHVKIEQAMTIVKQLHLLFAIREGLQSLIGKK